MAAGPTLLVDTSFLGDLLCAEPLIRAAAVRWPGAGVDFLAGPGGPHVLGGHPDLRELLVWDKRGADRGLGGLLRMARRLRERRYARVLCSHRSWRTSALLLMSGIPERVGFHNASGAWAWTRKVQYRKDLHEIERNLELLGGGNWERPRMYPSPAERARAVELAPESGFVAIAPGSLWETKRWPEEQYARLVHALSEAGVTCLLLGGPADQALCERLAASASSAHARNLAGECNLRESYSILKRASVLVTNDSAPMHLGVAATIPVVALYCSTLPSFGFAPRGKKDLVLEVPELECRPCGIHGHQKCPLEHFRCGRDLSWESVLSAVLNRLDH